MANYGQHYSTTKTPQREKAKAGQKENNAGGFTFVLDKWARLDRFLILGADGGSYYASEREMTRDNAKVVEECLAEDGSRTVARIAEISHSGRAPKNDAAIFALALAAASKDVPTRTSAYTALKLVCRTGTHLFQFVRDAKNFRGWSGGLRRAVAAWYGDKKPDKLAYQLLKYQQRHGYSNRDLLRLSHAEPPTPQHSAAYRWTIGGDNAERSVLNGKTKQARSYGPIVVDDIPRLLRAYDQELKASKSPKETAKLVREYGFTHEMVPNEHKKSPDVWEALLEKMPQTALVRNLGKMTAVGLFKPMGTATKKAAAMLADLDRLKKGRVHPIALLSALRVYEQGHGEKGKLTWEPMREVVDALNEAFYMAFDAITPTGKNHMLALDVSGSMSSGTIADCPGLTPRVASAAMAMVTARTEQNWYVMGFADHFIKLDISPKQRLDDVVRKISNIPFGGTDCALPMLHAIEKNIDVDCFVVFTDSETWSGDVHPFQALKQYRKHSGRDAKLAVVGMTATEFTIADPSDAGMLDFVGFDTAAPALLADFARGEGATLPSKEEAEDVE